MEFPKRIVSDLINGGMRMKNNIQEIKARNLIGNWKKEHQETTELTEIATSVCIIFFLVLNFFLTKRMDAQLVAIGFISTAVKEFYKLRKYKQKKYLIRFIASVVIIMACLVIHVSLTFNQSKTPQQATGYLTQPLWYTCHQDSFVILGEDKLL